MNEKSPIILSRYTAFTLTASAMIFMFLIQAPSAINAESLSNPNKSTTTMNTQPPTKLREPAVAGLFYPKDSAELAKAIEKYLTEAKPTSPQGKLRALICPHAGYEYSGPIAAFAYKLLIGHDEIKQVFILAPSHYAAFKGAYLPVVDAYETPLGSVKISNTLNQLVDKSPFIQQKPWRVERPRWSAMSSRTPADASTDKPDTWEHSAEVQIPFLQKVLKNFSIIPIIFGDVDPAKVAEGIAPLLDDSTLIVASSDLSHYYPYDKARQLDHGCVKAVTDLDIDKMHQQEACGQSPIITIMTLARQKGWKATLLDYRNSGDTSGNKSGVVGYASIAFYEPAAVSQKTEKTTSDETLSHEEGKYLLELARKSLTEVVTKGTLPKVDATSVPLKLKEIKGCFVTLTKKGDLRGCIGHIIPQEPLYKAVMDNAKSAALNDWRFSPVKPDELSSIEIEVSVLTVPKPLEFTSPEDLLKKLQPGKDGVVLQIGSRSSTFLPQVWDQLPGKEEFLGHLSQKAGCAPDAWREPKTKVQIYHVQAFEESEK